MRFTSRSSKTLVFGYHGKSNFGDDLFVEAMEEFGGAILNADVVEFMRTSRPKRGSLARAWHSATSGTSRMAAPLRAAELLWKLLRARNVAFCGGSLFVRPSGAHLILYVLTRMKLCTLSAYGVSVGPIQATGRGKAVLEYLVENCEPLIVRDRASLERLPVTASRQAAALGGDLAALHSGISNATSSETASRPGDYVLFIPCSTASNNHASAKLLANSLSGVDRVIVLSVNSNMDVGDDQLAIDCAQLIGDSGFASTAVMYSDVQTDGAIRYIANAKFVISARLHGAIAAYLMSVPFAIQSYHSKCDDFASDIGLKKERLLTSDATPATWKRAVEDLSANLSAGTSVEPSTYKSKALSIYLHA